MDIVYILKQQEENLDLRYSLRSVAKYVTGFEKIWCAGYKPKWLSDEVGYIPANQSGNKWQNALQNLINACQCNDVSEDFALFNDDFFALRPCNIQSVNYCCGTIDSAIRKWVCAGDSEWRRAFWQSKELLEKLGCEHFADFALHMPMLMNRHKFLKLMKLKEVRRHVRRYKHISFRTIYGNYYWSDPVVVNDCKPKRLRDATKAMMAAGWLSVLDGVTNDLGLYPNISKALNQFNEKCVYEKME